MTLKERAAAIIDCLSGSCDCEAHGHDDEAQVEKKLRESRDEVLKLVDEHASGKLKLCSEAAHDGPNCDTCKAMRDEADILAQKIRAL